MRIVDKGNDIIIEGNLYSSICSEIGEATIKVYEDETLLTTTTTDIHGHFTVTIPTSATGVRNFKVVYDGDSNYSGSESTTIEVMVRETPVPTTITTATDKDDCTLGERVYFTILVKDQYSDKMKNKTVQLKLGNSIIDSGATDDNGLVTLRFTPSSAGTFSLYAHCGSVDSATSSIIVTEGNIYELIADLGTTKGIIEESPLNRLGTPAHATQHDINLKINELINTGGGGGGGTDSVIMVGSFQIDDNGDLIVTLPSGTANPYWINEDGDLIYSTALQESE